MELIYGCEIIKCIPTKGCYFSEYEYCEGWTDFQGMGISVIGYCLRDRVISYYLSPFEEFKALAKACQHVIGFNSSSFDDNTILELSLKEDLKDPNTGKMLKLRAL